MQIDGSFREFGRIDGDLFARVRAEVDAITAEDWAQDTRRQNMYRSFHEDVLSIVLKLNGDPRAAYESAWGRFEPVLAPAIAAASRLAFGDVTGGGYCRIVLARLGAGAKIKPHVDAEVFHRVSHRLHLPVITNSGCLLTSGNDALHMQAGFLYELNNRQMHAAENNGTTARVHLVFDYVEAATVASWDEKVVAVERLVAARKAAGRAVDQEQVS